MRLALMILACCQFGACAAEGSDPQGDQPSAVGCETKTLSECDEDISCHPVVGRRVNVDVPCLWSDYEAFACRDLGAACATMVGVYARDGATWHVDDDCPGTSWAYSSDLSEIAGQLDACPEPPSEDEVCLSLPLEECEASGLPCAITFAAPYRQSLNCVLATERLACRGVADCGRREASLARDPDGELWRLSGPCPPPTWTAEQRIPVPESVQRCSERVDYCHYDCFGGAVCTEGVVREYIRAPVPCAEWTGDCPSIDNAYVCEKGCSAEGEYSHGPAKYACEEWRDKIVGDLCETRRDCLPAAFGTYLICDADSGTCVDTEPPAVADFWGSCGLTQADLKPTPGGDAYGAVPADDCVEGWCRFREVGSCVAQGCTRPCEWDQDCPIGVRCRTYRDWSPELADHIQVRVCDDPERSLQIPDGTCE